MKYRALVAAAMLFAAPPAFPQTHEPEVLEAISLRFRLAADLLPELLPLVEGHGSITGTGDQLLVKTSPARLLQVKEVVGALDVAPQDLWVSVRQVFARRHQPGAWGDESPEVRGTWGSKSFEGFEEGLQSILTQEGREALVEVRQDIPGEKALAIAGDEAVPAIVDDWYYDTLGTGFFVIPHRVGNAASLEIVTRHAVATEADREERELRTTLTGDLGEWIEIGHVLEEHAGRYATFRSLDELDKRTEHSVLVKVESAR
jgi:hypothetical protein